MFDKNGVRLTVLLVSYNHATYISQAVSSILCQKIDEPYEILIADDGSTDGTRQIVEELIASQSSAPPCRFLDSSVNLGVTANYRRAFKACQTDYVAVLEGDDYWVSPDKLRIQMGFLDGHHECVAVSANYFVYDEQACRFTARSAIDSEFRYLDARSLIHDNLIGNFSTCMYRLSALRSVPDALYDTKAYDWGVNICVARFGLIGFLHTPLSVYRIHGQGTWSGLTSRDRTVAQLDVIEQYNRLTQGTFDQEFLDLIERLEKSLDGPIGRKQGVPRLHAILIASLPPVILISLRSVGDFMKRFLLPPIIPIAIRKFQKRRP